MSPLAYFRSALIAPILLPVAAFVLAPDSVLAGLGAISLAFGGAAYLPFAAALWLALGKQPRVRQHIRLALISPLLFVPVQAVSWLLYCLFTEPQPPTARDVFGPLLPFAFYGVLLGYTYAAIVCGTYVLLRKLGAVALSESPESPSNPSSPNAA